MRANRDTLNNRIQISGERGRREGQYLNAKDHWIPAGETRMSHPKAALAHLTSKE